MRISDHIQKTHMKDPSLVEEEIVGSRVVYVPLTDEFHALNLSAQLVWILLDRQGAFDTGSRTGAKLLYANWFDPMPLDDVIETDVESVIKTFIAKGLLVEKPNTLVLHYLSCPLHEARGKRPYTSPSLVTYDPAWMRVNHPQVFYTLGYSDRWSPSAL